MSDSCAVCELSLLQLRNSSENFVVPLCERTLEARAAGTVDAVCVWYHLIMQSSAQTHDDDSSVDASARTAGESQTFSTVTGYQYGEVLLSTGPIHMEKLLATMFRQVTPEAADSENFHERIILLNAQNEVDIAMSKQVLTSSELICDEDRVPLSVDRSRESLDQEHDSAYTKPTDEGGDAGAASGAAASHITIPVSEARIRDCIYVAKHHSGDCVKNGNSSSSDSNSSSSDSPNDGCCCSRSDGGRCSRSDGSSSRSDGCGGNSTDDNGSISGDGRRATDSESEHESDSAVTFSHWRQAAQLLQPPVLVAIGDRVRIEVGIDVVAGVTYRVLH